MLNKMSLGVLGIWSLSLFFSCTVVHHDDDLAQKEEGGITFYFESEDFDAASYVSENWESRIIPEIKEKAEDLRVLIDLLQQDPDAAIAQYGVRKEDTSPFCFIVKGNIPVKSINTDSAAGLLYLDIKDLSGNGFCTIQIGPVIKKSAVRDALTFIHFGDFSNQIEFANISREINFYIKDNVVNNLGDSSQTNINAEFYGVFIFDETGNLVITPVELNIQAGD